MTLEIKYRPALKSDLKFLLDLRIQTMNPHLIATRVIGTGKILEILNATLKIDH